MGKRRKRMVLIEENQEKVIPPVEEEPKEKNKIEQANEAADKMKAQVDRYEELVKRNEEATAEVILSGKAEAGAVPEAPKEQTAEEYADKVMAGEEDES